VVNFAGLSGDFNPLHTDAEFGRQTPFGERIAHGMLVAAMASGMANWTGIFEGTTLALLEQVIRYKGVVKLGDTVHLELEVGDKRETSKPDRGVVRFNTRVLNQRDEVVIEGEWVLLMKRRGGA
jgi:acyl dehydratase